MIRRFNFFDKYMNKSGRGLAHGYMSYRWNNETLVFDLATSLAWQQSGSPNSMTYSDAEKYIRDLNVKRFAGYDDWRLPTLEEAMSLMERETKHGGLYIDPVFDRQQQWIWTADKESAGRAWYVDFSYGSCYHSDLHSVYDVRAVRS